MSPMSGSSCSVSAIFVYDENICVTPTISITPRSVTPSRRISPRWKAVPNADARLILAKVVLDRIELRELTAEQAIAAGDMKVEGDEKVVSEFLGLLDKVPFWFNIVTP